MKGTKTHDLPSGTGAKVNLRVILFKVPIDWLQVEKTKLWAAFRGVCMQYIDICSLHHCKNVKQAISVPYCRQMCKRTHISLGATSDGWKYTTCKTTKKCTRVIKEQDALLFFSSCAHMFWNTMDLKRLFWVFTNASRSAAVRKDQSARQHGSRSDLRVSGMTLVWGGAALVASRVAQRWDWQPLRWLKVDSVGSHVGLCWSNWRSGGAHKAHAQN